MRHLPFLLLFLSCYALAGPGALVLGGGSPTAVPGGTDTIGPISVSALSDDATSATDGANTNLERGTVAFGDWQPQFRVTAGRWDNITLLGTPANRTVTACTLEMQGDENYTATMTWRIYGCDVDDPPTYNVTTHQPGNQTHCPRTTNFDEFTSFSMTTGVFTAFDCTNAVQELIQSYTFNNAALSLIAIWISGASDYANHRAYNFTPGPETAFRLTFSYDY